ncbi:MAG: DUF3037 domain-containing protein [Flavobacteriaceae bacterium]|jgi:hypothetical protein|nr:DUF3037 domain-containing protein [Flavobacteriaceae bacterium]
MHEKHLYEYAVIRVVPRVECEEFLNVGLLLFCKRQKYLRSQIRFNINKLSLFQTELDVEQLKINLHSFELISKGVKNGGPIAQFEVSERFRWLSAVRSSCIQTSRPHCGFADDLDVTFEKLFDELIG